MNEFVLQTNELNYKWMNHSRMDEFSLKWMKFFGKWINTISKSDEFIMHTNELNWKRMNHLGNG